MYSIICIYEIFVNDSLFTEPLFSMSILISLGNPAESSISVQRSFPFRILSKLQYNVILSVVIRSKYGTDVSSAPEIAEGYTDEKQCMEWTEEVREMILTVLLCRNNCFDFKVYLYIESHK